jgi:uncharacterized protein
MRSAFKIEIRNQNMNPIDILAEYYDRRSKTFNILVDHGKQVAEKALMTAGQVSHLKPDLKLIENAAMLHDIGIMETDSPGLGCRGKHPYICHGILGREMLEKIGMSEYGLICERHVGVGISAEDVSRFNLPLPARDMLPVTIEEQIICYADKFFSKNGNGRKAEEKTVSRIVSDLKRYGPDKVKRFQSWVEMFDK